MKNNWSPLLVKKDRASVTGEKPLTGSLPPLTGEKKLVPITGEKKLVPLTGEKKLVPLTGEKKLGPSLAYEEDLHSYTNQLLPVSDRCQMALYNLWCYLHGLMHPGEKCYVTPEGVPASASGDALPAS